MYENNLLIEKYIFDKDISQVTKESYPHCDNPECEVYCFRYKYPNNEYVPFDYADYSETLNLMYKLGKKGCTILWHSFIFHTKAYKD